MASPAEQAIPRRWSMFTQSGVVAGSSCRLHRGVGPRDDRPRASVRCRFAGKVSLVLVREGGVEILSQLKTTCCREPVFAVALHDGMSSSESNSPSERTWRRSRERITISARRSPRVAMTVDVMFARLLQGLHVGDYGVPAVQNPAFTM